LRKAKLNAFAAQEEVEDFEEQAKALTREMRVLETENSTFQEEETEFEEHYSRVSLTYSMMEEDEKKHQEIIDEAREVYTGLKHRIAALREDEEDIVRRLNSDTSVDFTAEVEEESRRTEIIQKGYQTKIMYTNDVVASLSGALQTELLKLEVGKSEHRRLSQAFLPDYEESVEELEAKDQQRKEKLGNLLQKVDKLERSKAELQKELTDRRLALVAKSTELEEEGDRRNFLAKVGFLENFCGLVEEAVGDVGRAIEDWNLDGTGLESAKLKDWFQWISGMMDAIEDLEIRSNIVS
jgi:chromosome segregation ATPase